MSSPRKNLSLLLLLLVVVEGQRPPPLGNFLPDINRFLLGDSIPIEKRIELIDEICSTPSDPSTEPEKSCLSSLPVCDDDAYDLKECANSSEIVLKPQRLSPYDLLFELLQAPLRCYMENKDLITIEEDGSITIDAEQFQAWTAQADDDGIKNAGNFCVDAYDNPGAIMKCLVDECIKAASAPK